MKSRLSILAFSLLLLFLASASYPQATDNVDGLIATLKSEDSFVRQAAAVELGKIKDTRAVAPLSTALRDKDWGVRHVAALALGKIGQPAVTPLISALKDDDWVVRQEAASGLPIVGEPAVVPLIAALKDGDWRMRSGAATALGKIKDVRAIAPLIAVLTDKDQLVHQAVASALGDIGEPAAWPLIATFNNPDWRVVCSAVEALGKVGKPAARYLIEALRDETRPNRWAAAWSLEIIGTPEGKQAVDKFLQGKSLAQVTENYSYMLRKAEPNTEYLLILALERCGHPTGYGYPKMAQDLLNSGNPLLTEAGRRWAVRYNYEILNSYGPTGAPRWGNRPQ